MADRRDKSELLHHEPLGVPQLTAQLEQAKAEAKKAQELLRGLLNAIDSSADAIVFYDLEGNTQYVSDSFTRLFGWTKEEVLGRKTPFVPKSEEATSLSQISRLIDDGKAMSGFETRRLTKSGILLDVSLSSSRYLDHKGEPVGILVILRDITAWKSIQRAKQRAVNHLSHELTTPVAIIDASLPKLAKNDLAAEERKVSLDRIRRNVDRLRQIQLSVQQILEPRQVQAQTLSCHSVRPGHPGYPSEAKPPSIGGHIALFATCEFFGDRSRRARESTHHAREELD